MAAQRVRTLALMAAALALAAAAAGALVLARLDSLACAGVEYWGRRALGLDVRVQTADVRLFSDQVTLTGLCVANPPEAGFRERDVLFVQRLTVRGSLWPAIVARRFRAREVVIESPRFTLEERAGVANLDALLRRSPSAPRHAPGLSGGEERRRRAFHLRIERVLIRNLAVRAIADGVERSSFAASEIEIPDLCGQNGRDMEPDRAVAVLLERIFGQDAPATPKEAPPAGEAHHGR